MRIERVKRKEEAEYLKYVLGIETQFGKMVLMEGVDYIPLFERFNSEYKRNAHRFNQRSMFMKADVNHFENTYKPLEHGRRNHN
jgi:hypothetical protein